MISRRDEGGPSIKEDAATGVSEIAILCRFQWPGERRMARGGRREQR